MTYQFKNNMCLVFDNCIINFDKVAAVKLCGSSLIFIGDKGSEIHKRQYESSRRAEQGLKEITEILNGMVC